MVEVGLGRVDRDDGDPVLAHDRAALADQLLEMHVADVSGVVVSGHDNECVALDGVQVALRLGEFLLEPEGREIA